MGDWFSGNFRMSIDARQTAQTFMRERATQAAMPPATLASIEKIVSPAVCARVNLMATLRNIAKNWDFKAFAQNPCTTEVQIHAVHVDLIILTMMGFLAVGPGRATLAAYKRDSESFVKACNRMLDWDPDVSMEELRQIVPEADEDTVGSDHSVADRPCFECQSCPLV